MQKQIQNLRENGITQTILGWMPMSFQPEDQVSV